jgi:formiminotetrahydrofolate cyclodeaminase
MMTKALTKTTIREFTEQVGHQSHAMAGATIAASAAQAISLGRACMQITLNKTSANKRSILGHIVQLDTFTETLLEWSDRDAVAIAEFVALREAGEALKGKQMLCQAPAEISRLSIESASLFLEFREYVTEQVQDDLEMSIVLLTGAARAALLLLDSNLRIWPDPELLAEFEPVLLNLEEKIRRLTPVARIRT